ncbi:MAG: DNA-binding protein [Gammaproteobacteria bacterium]|nr:DNA-binding protein [Gammaproteobacteria bacterium]NIW96988.1 DNA-binding protein [Phycisphaerae bacterium]
MSDITITVPEDQLTKLREKASRLGVTLADLVLISIEEMLSRPDEDYRQAADYVLPKNAELYRRLA